MACIWSARATRSLSGSPSTMPTSAGAAVAGSRCAPRATRRTSRCEPRRSRLSTRSHIVSNAACMSSAAGPSMRTAVSRHLPRWRVVLPIHSSPMPTPPVMPSLRVDDEQLAVVARDQAEPGAQSRWVEDAQLDARLPDRREEAGLGAAHADPVGEQAHAHAARHRPRERLGDAMSDLVGAEDVALEDDRLARCVDRPRSSRRRCAGRRAAARRRCRWRRRRPRCARVRARRPDRPATPLAGRRGGLRQRGPAATFGRGARQSATMGSGGAARLNVTRRYLAPQPCRAACMPRAARSRMASAAPACRGSARGGRRRCFESPPARP